MGIDALERRVAYFAGALAMLLAAILLPHLFKNTWVTDSIKPAANNACSAPYHLVGTTCQYRHLTHPSDWVLQFVEIFVLGLGLLYFAWRRKRAGVSVVALLMGLALGVVGLPFLFLGGWLVIRALRLQKYGDPSFVGSSRAARAGANTQRAERAEQRAARREGRASATPSVRELPTASKRYTPKQRRRPR